MLSNRETIFTVALMAVCCALPLLLIGGVGIGAGVLLREAALVVIGLGVLGYAIYKINRSRRGQ